MRINFPRRPSPGDLQQAAKNDGREEVLNTVERHEGHNDDSHGTGGSRYHAWTSAEDGGDQSDKESGIESDQRRDPGDKSKSNGFRNESQGDGDARKKVVLCLAINQSRQIQLH